MRTIIALFCMLALGASSSVQAKTNLSAEKYYQMGVKAKKQGRCEKSRNAMLWACHVGKNTQTGKNAALYIKTMLPRFKVTKAAEQANIKAYTAEHSGRREQAKKLYLHAISSYPNFEWPYSNLASIYSTEKNYSEAKRLYNKALRINPHYVHALIGLGMNYMSAGDTSGAQHYLKLAERENPSEDSVVAFKLLLTKYKSLKTRIENLNR